MSDEVTQVLIMVGAMGLTEGHIQHFKFKPLEQHLGVLLKGKYVYLNPEGQYKLTVKGQKAYKEAKRIWVIEIGDLKTGETFDLSLDEWEQADTKH